MMEAIQNPLIETNWILYPKENWHKKQKRLSGNDKQQATGMKEIIKARGYLIFLNIVPLAKNLAKKFISEFVLDRDSERVQFIKVTYIWLLGQNLNRPSANAIIF
jgi:hypothetical protein